MLLGVALLVSAGWLTLALPALTFLNYCALAGGMLLAWRFHCSRIFLSLLVLFLAQQAIGLSTGQPRLISTTVEAVAILVPANFLLIAMMHERGFTLASLAPLGLLLFVQAVTVAVFSGAAGQKPSPGRYLASLAIPEYAVIVFVSVLVLLAIRVVITRKPADSALLWSLGAFFLALRFTVNARLTTLYWSTAACILGAAIVENSYLLAYHDELTSLPSRRAFNDALLRLQHPYSIAVVDIDHFKKFNDTHGHDTGDQVLQLVAANLARVTGGGQAYRCGGEEFMILYPGKVTAEVVNPLEQLRKTIASSQFHLRGGDRRQAPRGPDRRNPLARGQARKGDAIRKLAEKSPPSLSVTVSIGLATSSKAPIDPEVVIRAADKALYRAKANGRNRLETASKAPRERAKAAGIA
jgi:GGDEF domain-containing protein